MRRYEVDSPGSGEGAVVGSCEHGNEPRGSIIGWEFLEWLSDWRFLKKIQFHVVSSLARIALPLHDIPSQILNTKNTVYFNAFSL
jgi:hypothetical protein